MSKHKCLEHLHGFLFHVVHRKRPTELGEYLFDGQWRRFDAIFKLQPCLRVLLACIEEGDCAGKTRGIVATPAILSLDPAKQSWGERAV